MLEPGQRIDARYEVEALVGEGGLARVYRVRHVELGSIHALKLLQFRKASLDQRLLLEGRIQAQLRHPNVVAVTDVVRHDGQFGLLMEYVDHVTLEAWLGRNAPVPVHDALELLAPILAGVAAAHNAGVLHRDLKPANVLLARTTRGFVPKVTDFGIAKVVRDDLEGGTRGGIAMGTPGYMAPEQVLDASSVDRRTDVFALGAVAYEMISGRRAFADASGDVAVRSTLEGTLIPLDEVRSDVPPGVSAAVGRALQRDRDLRFDDVVGFARALLAERPDLLLTVLGTDDDVPTMLSLELPPPTPVPPPTPPSASSSPSPSPTANVVRSPKTYDGGTADPDSLGPPPAEPPTAELVRPSGAPPFWIGALLAAGLLLMGGSLGVLVAGPGLGAWLGGTPQSLDEPTVVAPGLELVPANDLPPPPDPVQVAETPEPGSGPVDRPDQTTPAAASSTSQPARAIATPPPEAPAVVAPTADPSPPATADAPEGEVSPVSQSPDPEPAEPISAVVAPPVATPQPEAVVAAPAVPEPPAVAPGALERAAFVGTAWQGDVFRRPFTLSILAERGGRMWAEGRLVNGADQRVLSLSGTYEPSTGALQLRETHGELVLVGTLRDGRIRGTYQREGRATAPLELNRR